MTAIAVRGLHKRYGDVNAVNGIDLEIEYGEVFSLLGPNGAGKTTTVEILEGHRPRTSGDVQVLGQDPQRAGREWRAGIGIVLQDAADAGNLRVREVVSHFARYYPDPRPVDEVLDLVGLTGSAGRLVRLLSGGQRRRLDVAVGILGRPRLLFLDEPTTGFDPQARRQFWDLIRTLAGEGTTILLTTHYLEEAEALADRLAVVMAGQVVATGTPETIGGRARAGTTVSWLDGGQPHRVQTGEPGTVVAELTARFGPAIPGLTVSRPSLEDIYLDLIGRAA